MKEINDLDAAYERLPRGAKVIIFALTPAIAVAGILAFMYGFVYTLLFGVPDQKDK